MDLEEKARILLFDNLGYFPDNLIANFSSLNYPIILKTKDNKELHFFLYDEMGLLFYDGWDVEKENEC